MPMSSALTHGDGQDVLAAWKRAWERRDPDAAVELFSPGAELRNDPFEEPLVGANAIRAHWNAFAAGSLHAEFDAERIWVVNRTVLASWHAAMTDRGTAERKRLRGFLTLELDDAAHIERARLWTLTRIVGADSTVRPDRAASASEGR